MSEYDPHDLLNIAMRNLGRNVMADAEARASVSLDGCDGGTHHAGCACHEARRDAELDELRDTMRYMVRNWSEERGTMIDRIQALRARVAELEAILAPFARFGKVFLTDPDCRHYGDGVILTVAPMRSCEDAATVGDLRRAAVAGEGAGE